MLQLFGLLAHEHLFLYLANIYGYTKENLFLVFCLADLYGCCMADPRGYNAVLLL